MEFRDYLTFLKDLQQELEALTAVEQQKIAAIRAGNLEALDSCMKQEQAAALSLRGREQRRDAMLRALKLEQVPLRALPGKSPPELKGETSRMVEALLKTYQVLSSAQGTARTLMESDLHLIEKQLSQREDTGPQAPPSQPARKTDFRA